MTDMPLSQLASFSAMERGVDDGTPASSPAPERIIAAIFAWRPSLSRRIPKYVEQSWHGAALTVRDFNGEWSDLTDPLLSGRRRR